MDTLKTIKLTPPIRYFSSKDNISQLFGENRDFYQKHFSMPAHNGIDIVVRNKEHGYGTPIIASHGGTVEKIGYDVPHQTRGNGIYILDNSGEFSTVYWHLSAFQCNIGEKVLAGQVIGLLGNSGFVRPKPTKQDPYNGSHLHWAIKFYKELNSYQYYSYNGFCDPLPYMNSWLEKSFPIQVCFPRNLYVGKSGNDVAWLQSILKLELGEIGFEPTGYFGNATRKAVMQMQAKHGITPILGFVGHKTRKFITNKWTVYK